MAERDYQRLTFAAARSGFAVAPTRSSVWLAKDHLLCIDSNGFGETYKRFFFRDIHSITIHGTLRRVYWNWFLGIPTAVFILGGVPYFALGSGHGAGEVIAAAIITALFLIPLVINNVLGPTCIFRIKTAVQTEELPSLRRVRKAQKVLERLRPFIAGFQGSLSPEEVAARFRGFGAEQPRAAATPAETAAILAPSLATIGQPAAAVSQVRVSPAPESPTQSGQA